MTVELDCRYAGQSHDIRVPSVLEFSAEHERRNGYPDRDAPVEVTALRAVISAPAPAGIEDVLAGWEGRWPEPVTGPRVEMREDCTIWVPDGWSGEEGPLGSLVLRRTDPDHGTEPWARPRRRQRRTDVRSSPNP